MVSPERRRPQRRERLSHARRAQLRLRRARSPCSPNIRRGCPRAPAPL